MTAMGHYRSPCFHNRRAPAHHPYRHVRRRGTRIYSHLDLCRHQRPAVHAAVLRRRGAPYCAPGLWYGAAAAAAPDYARQAYPASHPPAPLSELRLRSDPISASGRETSQLAQGLKTAEFAWHIPSAESKRISTDAHRPCLDWFAIILVRHSRESGNPGASNSGYPGPPLSRGRREPTQLNAGDRVQPKREFCCRFAADAANRSNCRK